VMCNYTGYPVSTQLWLLLLSDLCQAPTSVRLLSIQTSMQESAKESAWQ